jgi:hypothetical protein
MIGKANAITKEETEDLLDILEDLLKSSISSNFRDPVDWKG